MPHARGTQEGEQEPLSVKPGGRPGSPRCIYSNVGKRLAGENIYHGHNVLVAVAGGLPATLPFEHEFINEKTAPFLRKYLAR